MAFKLIFVCVLIVATAKANFWDNNPAFQGFPQFPPLPSFPQLHFPTIPPIPPINIPKPLTPAEIIKNAKLNAGPNSDSNSVVVSSSSSVTTKDGKTVKEGGTTVFTNNNGEVHKFEFGNKPPKIDEDSPIVEVPLITPIVIPQIPQVPVWQPFDLLTPVIQAVNTNGANVFQYVNSNGAGGFQAVNINSNGGGGFASSSSSSFSHSTDGNGVKTGGGIASTYYNVNGKTGGQTIQYSTN